MITMLASRIADFMLNHTSGQNKMKLARIVVYLLIINTISYNIAGKSGNCLYSPWLPECRAQQAGNSKNPRAGKSIDVVEPQFPTTSELTTVSAKIQLSGKISSFYN